MKVNKELMTKNELVKRFKQIFPYKNIFTPIFVNYVAIATEDDNVICEICRNDPRHGEPDMFGVTTVRVDKHGYASADHTNSRSFVGENAENRAYKFACSICIEAEAPYVEDDEDELPDEPQMYVTGDDKREPEKQS